MTWAILAVISLLLSGAKQEILSPKMDKVETFMEQTYQRQGSGNVMTSWCVVSDKSVEKDRVINVYECSKNVEFFVVLDLAYKKRYRIWDFKSSVFTLLK